MSKPADLDGGQRPLWKSPGRRIMVMWDGWRIEDARVHQPQLREAPRIGERQLRLLHSDDERLAADRVSDWHWGGSRG